MRQEAIEAIERERLVAIIRGVSADKILPLAQSLYEGGIRLLEVTFDSTGRVSDEETATMIGMLAKEMRGKMQIGAGTVLTAEQVALTANAGGEFIISPNTDAAVIKKSLEFGLVPIPGAYTPTEVCTALTLGADFVKLFPVTTLGPEYVKALRAPLGHARLLAVGGIDCDNIPDYLAAGVAGFGIGSSLTDKRLIASESWGEITALARRYVEAVKK